MNLNPEQEKVFQMIYLRVLFQISIEIMDNLKGTRAYDGKMRVKMNDCYQMLDKYTKNYDELYQASAEGTTAYYLSVVSNVKRLVTLNLPEQTILDSLLSAWEKDEKSMNGIMKKVLQLPIKQ